MFLAGACCSLSCFFMGSSRAISDVIDSYVHRILFNHTYISIRYVKSFLRIGVRSNLSGVH